jgi:hypothetical protein
MLASTGGRFAFPLDDAYIYLQYATQNGSGQFFRYNDGDPATSGATSLLYALLLSPFAIVFKGTALAIVAFVCSLPFVAMSLRLVHRLATRWIDPSAAWPATFLCALSGPFLWGSWSGMETALVAWLALASLDGFDRVTAGDADAVTRRSRRWFVIATSLFAAARPECAALVSGWLAIVWIVSRNRPAARLGARTLLIPVLAGLVPFLLTLVLTGSPSATTLASKGAPFMPGTSIGTWLIESSLFFVHNLKALFDSGDSASPAWPSAYTTLTTFAAPFTLFFAALGLAPALAREIRERRPSIATAAGTWLIGALTIWAALVPINLHWSRYLTPYLPLLTLLVVAGIHRFAALVRDDETRRAFVRGFNGLFVAFNIPIFLFFAGVYGWNAREIASQHIEMAKWLRERAAPGSWIGTNDVGAIAYYGGRPVLDLHGLTSRGLAACKQVGSSAIYEHLEALPPAMRPSYLVVIPGWFEPNFLRLHRPARSQTLRKAMIAGNPLVAFQASWEACGSGDHPGPEVTSQLGAGRLVDRIDIADLASEAAHDYSLELLAGESAGPLGILTAPGATGPSVDGGRLVTKRERFNVRIAPGRDAVLVMRSMGPVRALLQVDGGHPIRVGGGSAETNEHWTEIAVPVPGTLLRSASPRFSIEALDGAFEEGGYTSFHYWVFQ